MLYEILFPMAGEFAVLNVFRYLTFRTGGAVITALIISFMVEIGRAHVELQSR